MRDTTALDNERNPAMSLCVGLCQMDDYGYCIGCGRTQAEIDGGEPPPPQDAAQACASVGIAQPAEGEPH